MAEVGVKNRQQNPRKIVGVGDYYVRLREGRKEAVVRGGSEVLSE